MQRITNLSTSVAGILVLASYIVQNLDIADLLFFNLLIHKVFNKLIAVGQNFT